MPRVTATDGIPSLVVHTYRLLVEVLGYGNHFWESVDPDDPWRFPANCDRDALERRLREFREMLVKNFSVEIREKADCLITQEIHKMKDKLSEAEHRIDAALVELPPADARQVYDSVLKSISGVDLNAVFQHRLTFGSVAEKGGTFTLEEKFYLKQAVEDTYRRIESSGLNEILASQHNFLLRYAAATEGRDSNLPNNTPENEREFDRKWGMLVPIESRNWSAIVFGGLEVTGAVLALATCVSRGHCGPEEVAGICSALVALKSGTRTIRDAI